MVLATVHIDHNSETRDLIVMGAKHSSCDAEFGILEYDGLSSATIYEDALNAWFGPNELIHRVVSLTNMKMESKHLSFLMNFALPRMQLCHDVILDEVAVPEDYWVYFLDAISSFFIPESKRTLFDSDRSVYSKTFKFFNTEELPASVQKQLIDLCDTLTGEVYLEFSFDMLSEATWKELIRLNKQKPHNIEVEGAENEFAVQKYFKRHFRQQLDEPIAKRRRID